MASAELSRRVEKVVGYPPLSEMGKHQRHEFQEALLDAETFEDLPGKWQAAILKAEQNRPRLRVVPKRLARLGACARRGRRSSPPGASASRRYAATRRWPRTRR
jgi:hypothetical protein